MTPSPEARRAQIWQNTPQDASPSMNAPLPSKLAGDAACSSPPTSTYESVARISNQIAGKLAQRLQTETRGEARFTPADRGRYATAASIYQAMPVGVFVPQTADDVQIALDICRDLNVPVVPRGGGTSQCGQTVGAGLVIDCSKHLRRV